MFFHLSIHHYAPVLTSFWFGFGACKKEGSYDGNCCGIPAPPYRDVCGYEIFAGLVIRFGLMARLRLGLIIVCI